MRCSPRPAHRPSVTGTANCQPAFGRTTEPPFTSPRLAKMMARGRSAFRPSISGGMRTASRFRLRTMMRGTSLIRGCVLPTGGCWEFLPASRLARDGPLRGCACELFHIPYHQQCRSRAPPHPPAFSRLSQQGHTAHSKRLSRRLPRKVRTSQKRGYLAQSSQT